MIKRFLLLIEFCMFFIFVSCVQDIGPEGVSFDKETFEVQKAKWEKANLNNYKFTYSFDGYRPELYKGEVIVIDNLSNVKVYNTEEYKDNTMPTLSEDSEYYIKDIPMLFDKIYSEYERSLKRVEDGEYRYIEIQCEYDETYGYPVIIKNPGSGGREGKKAGMMGYRNVDFDFQINNFSLIEKQE